MRKIFTRLLLSWLFCLPLLVLAGGPCSITVSHVVTDETCPGFYDGTISLNVNGANGYVTYLWSSGDTTQNIPSATSGTYTVILTDTMGCMAYDTVVVTATYAITVDLGPDTILCNVTGYLLHATTPGANFYYWQDNSQDSVHSAQGPGLYTVFVQNAIGCFDEDSVVLSQHPTPSPSIAVTHPGCGAVLGALDLSIASGTSPFAFLWSNGATTEDISALAVGNYAVTVTDSNGCTSATRAMVIPPVDLSDFQVGALQVCSSHTIQFAPLQYGIEFDGVDDYIAVPDTPFIRPAAEWTMEAWIMPTGATGPAQTVLEKRTSAEDGYSIRYDPTTRTLSARLQNGPMLAQLSPTNILTLYQWAHIALVVDGPSVSFYINGMLATSMNYTGGVDPTIGTPLTIGGGPNRQSFRGRIDEVVHWTMPLTASEVNELRFKSLPMGLQGLGLFVNFNEQPGGNSATDGSGNSLPVDFVNIDTAVAWIQTNPLSLNFIWDFGDGTVNNSQAPYHGYLPRVWQTMVVTLTVTSDQACQTADTFLLPVHTPAVPFINADTGSQYCLGDTVKLWMQTGYANYSWTTGATNDTILALTSGNYVGTANDGMGCIHTGSLPINFNPNSTPMPIVTPAVNLTMCEGDTLVLDVGSGYSYYLWNTGDTTSTIQVTDSGSYYVAVQNGFGCERTSAAVNVTAYPAPVATISAAGNTLTSSSGLTYQWFLNGNPIPGAIGNTLVAATSGNYTVLVGGQGGCTTLSAPYSFIVGMEEVFEWGSVSVFPNPTSEWSQVKLILRKPALVTVELMDLTGKQVYEAVQRSPVGTSYLKLPMAHIARGAYLLKLTVGSDFWVTRVNKM